MTADDKDIMPILTHQSLGFDKPARKLDFDDDDEVPEPKPEPEPVIIDPFSEEIAKVKKAQSPAVRDTMERANCFGRNWYIESAGITDTDTDEGGICDQWECDLRFLCELVYNRATGKETVQQKDEHPVSFMDSQAIPDQPTKGRRKKKIKIRRTYTRYPYVDQGRPIDKLATSIWKLLGGPPSLPESWSFPAVKTKQDLKVAPQQFRDRFGPGIMVSKRSNYHQFFKDGSHFLRLWMNVPGGGWMDVTGELAKAIMKAAPTLKLEHPPELARKRRYRFYPYRIFIQRESHLQRLAKAFERLDIDPMADQEQENENEG